MLVLCGARYATDTVAQYWSSTPTFASGSNVPLQTDANGNLKTVASSGGGVPAGATAEQASSNGSPITTATTVQIFAAQASSKHHAWIKWVNAGLTPTEVQILDGSTVVDDFYAPSNGGGVQDSMPIGAFGSTNTALSIKVLTAGASIYWTARGFYGAN